MQIVSGALWRNPCDGKRQTNAACRMCAYLMAACACRETFQHYVLQDAFFLAHFGKAYAAAIDKLDADSPSTRDTPLPNGNSNGPTNGTSSSSNGSTEDLSAARAVLYQLLSGVHQELQLHGSYAAKWGVDVSDGALLPSPATAAYCSFLLEVAQDPKVRVMGGRAGGRGGGGGCMHWQVEASTGGRPVQAAAGCVHEALQLHQSAR
jgi:hypothetical protein